MQVSAKKLTIAEKGASLKASDRFLEIFRCQPCQCLLSKFGQRARAYFARNRRPLELAERVKVGRLARVLFASSFGIVRGLFWWISFADERCDDACSLFLSLACDLLPRE